MDGGRLNCYTPSYTACTVSTIKTGSNYISNGFVEVGMGMAVRLNKWSGEFTSDLYEDWHQLSVISILYCDQTALALYGGSVC